MYSGPANGLYTSPNVFNASPAGSLATADNVVFTAPSVIQPRRGMDVMFDSEFGTLGSVADAIAFYGNRILVAYDHTKIAMRVDELGQSFNDFDGTYVPPSSNRMRFVGAARSEFFNTTTGLHVYDGVGNPTIAGNPQGLNVSAVNVSSDTGWQLPGTAVAYRFTICSKNAFGRVVEGAPSGRTVLRNDLTFSPGELVVNGGGTTVSVPAFTLDQTPHNLQVGDVLTLAPGGETYYVAGNYTVASTPTNFNFTYDGGVAAFVDEFNAETQSFEITRSAEVTCYLPFDPAANPVTEDNFIRVYRSEMTSTAPDPITGLVVPPSDNLYRVYESAYLGPTELAAGYLVFADIQPELGEAIPLYTNPNTGEGSLQANYQAPLARDIAYWGNRMWFANTTNKESVQCSLIGVGSPDGLQDGDQFIFMPAPGDFPNATVFTAKATPTVPFVDFQLYTDGDPGWNIERTARALVQAINDYPSFAAAPVYAYYTSSETGTPGRMLFVAREFGDSHKFYLFSSRGTAFTPQLPEQVDPAFDVPSDNNRHAAGLFYSKFGQPEAVPIVNKLEVESDNDEILRIFPLQYRLIIFKTSGIYAVQNQEPFSVQKISDYKLIAPDSLALLDERIYGLTDQGIITVGDGGVTPMSIPIDNALMALGGPESLADLKVQSVGLAYRSARQYICWLIDRNAEDTAFTEENAQAYLYSTLSGGFTRFTFGVRCATVDPTNDKLVVAPTDDNRLWVENKTLTTLDYADHTNLDLTGLLVSVTGSEVELPSVDGVSVGDAITVSHNSFLISEIDEATSTVTVLGEPPFVATQRYVIDSAIPTSVVFNKMTGGTPAAMKMIQQVSYLFRTNNFYKTTATFSSEISIIDNPVELVPFENDVWGESDWGELPYGNPVQQVRRVEELPMATANCCQLSIGFNTRQAFAKFELLGVDVVSIADTDANRG